MAGCSRPKISLETLVHPGHPMGDKVKFSNTVLYSTKDVALLLGYSMVSDCFYPLEKNVNESNFFLRESNLFQVMVF